MRLPCWIIGHSWGGWSRPSKAIITTTEYTFHYAPGKTQREETAVQYRTCDPCGKQQRRIAEAAA